MCYDVTGLVTSYIGYENFEEIYEDMEINHLLRACQETSKKTSLNKLNYDIDNIIDNEYWKIEEWQTINIHIDNKHRTQTNFINKSHKILFFIKDITLCVTTTEKMKIEQIFRNCELFIGGVKIERIESLLHDVMCIKNKLVNYIEKVNNDNNTYYYEITLPFDLSSDSKAIPYTHYSYIDLYIEWNNNEKITNIELKYLESNKITFRKAINKKSIDFPIMRYEYYGEELVNKNKYWQQKTIYYNFWSTCLIYICTDENNEIIKENLIKNPMISLYGHNVTDEKYEIINIEGKHIMPLVKMNRNEKVDLTNSIYLSSLDNHKFIFVTENLSKNFNLHSFYQTYNIIRFSCSIDNNGNIAGFGEGTIKYST